MTVSLPSYAHANILVVGDIMLDRYWSGPTSRISPEAPVPVVKIGDCEDRLGGAANVALNLSTLGCKTSLCGIIGNDEAGETIGKLLTRSSINDCLVRDNTNPTITKLRVLSRHQQLLRMDFEEPLTDTANTTLIESIKSTIDSVDAVVISDYAKGTVTTPQDIIALCKKHSVPIFVDPKGSNFSKYKEASYITPNLSELEGIVGKSESLNEVFIKAQNLQRELSLDGLLVTLSEKGMALISESAEVFHMPTVAKDVFDVTGAGDTVIATLAASFAAGSDIQTAMRLANIAAGVVVGKLGTSAVTQKELIEALADDDKQLTRGTTSLDELTKQLEICRQKNEKIVFTNGCFDILHAGHVRYLKAAAELGDRLVLGLNSDESIKQLKGDTRPIIPLQERLEVMSALNCVDWVIPFEEDTPIHLIETLLPDVLAKGGDYAAEEIVGYECVTQNGGEVTVLSFVDGCSTTAIIEKIKKINP